jgi:hypothetical protein
MSQGASGRCGRLVGRRAAGRLFVGVRQTGPQGLRFPFGLGSAAVGLLYSPLIKMAQAVKGELK